MLDAASAVIPIFCLIALGAVLARGKFMSDEMWAALDHLCFYVLFPALLVRTLAAANFADLALTAFVVALIAANVLNIALQVALKPLLGRVFGLTNSAFTSVFQGVTRWHGFIALALVDALHGAQGIAILAIVMVVLFPILNATTIGALVRWGTVNGNAARPSVLRQLITNPMILGTLVGLAINLLGIGIAKPITDSIDLLAGGALGISLLAVGAGLRPLDTRRDVGFLTFAVLARLLVSPLIMYLAMTLAGIDGLARTVAVISAAVPTATSAYVLARKMGGDAPLMAGIVTAQVVFAIATLPLVIWLSEAL